MSASDLTTPRGAGFALALCAGLLFAACTPEPAETPPSTRAETALPTASDDASAAAAKTADAKPPQSDALLLPGDFTADTDLAALERRFGKANVRDGDLPGPEGTTAPGVTVYPDDPTRRAYLYASEAPGTRRFERIRVFDTGSLWRLDGDIGVGSPLADVLRANGGAFDFSGTGWDYGGYVLDWRGGAFSTKPGRPVSVVRLELSEAFLQTPRGKGPMPMGEGTFRSDDPRWPDLEMTVSEVGVLFPPLDAAP